MKILIIGGAGFIGSHLCESYANEHIVTSLDNYISGKKNNHIHNVKYLDMDAKNILSLQEDYDLIFHLGEYSRVENSLHKIDYVLTNNLRPILDILQFAKKSKAKLIYAGSSTKFADGGENKFKSPYAFSKWQNSELVKFYCDSNGEFATVIAKFLERKKLNKRLKITRPGTQLRNFTHIDDTVDALKLIAANGIGDDYGIANPKSYSINEVANLISEDIEYVNENAANRLSSSIISEKTINLGWTPNKELEEYIRSKV